MDEVDGRVDRDRDHPRADRAEEGEDEVDVVRLLNMGGQLFAGVGCSGIVASVARRKDERLFT